MSQPSGNACYRLLSPQPHFHQISPRVFINLYHRWVIRFLHIRQGIDRPQFIKYTQVCVMGFPIQRAVSSCNWFSQNYQTVAVIWLTFPYIFLNACWHPFNWVLASLGISSICPKQLQAFKKIYGKGNRWAPLCWAQFKNKSRLQISKVWADDEKPLLSRFRPLSRRNSIGVHAAPFTHPPASLSPLLELALTNVKLTSELLTWI